MSMHDYVRVEGHELSSLDPELIARKQDDAEEPVRGPKGRRLFVVRADKGPGENPAPL